MFDSEANLVARLNNGDTEAANDVFRKYYSELLLHAFYILKDKEDAKDAVQQCFAYLLAHNKLVKITDSLPGYLQTSVHNQCLKTLQKRERKHREIESWEGLVSLTQNSAPEFDEATTAKLHKIVRELSSLPAQQRRSVTLVHWEGLPYSDAAALMRISVNTLKTHLKTGIAAIRRAFK